MLKKSYFFLSAVGILAAGLLSACTLDNKAETPIPSDTSASAHQILDNTGDSFGSFTTSDIYDNKVTEAIFADHDLTMVNVFATWCGPCIQEMPALADLAKEYEGSNFQIVGLILDVNETGIVSAAKLDTAKELASLTGAEYPIILPHITMRSGILADTYSIPETFFVDSSGSIVSERYVGSRSKSAWQKIITQELSKVNN